LPQGGSKLLAVGSIDLLLVVSNSVAVDESN